MRYLLRAVKYFLTLMIILALVLTVFVITEFVPADPAQMFVGGYRSMGQIALIMFVLSLIYPRVGYGRRMARVFGSPEEVRPVIGEVMDMLGYRQEKDLGTTLTFVRRSPVSRALKMWEDRITLDISGTGIEAEGLVRDLVRVVSALEARDRRDRDSADEQ